MEDLSPIFEQLKRARAGLESAAAPISDDFWQRQPRPGRWSAAEVVAHLTMVENKVNQSAGKVIRHSPRPMPIWQRVHLPPWFVKYRLVRFKTPVPLDPSLVSAKSNMLSQLTFARKQSLALLEQVMDRDMSVYWWKHPLLGQLNFYDWYRMLAHHEVRHTKQLREIRHLMIPT